MRKSVKDSIMSITNDLHKSGVFNDTAARKMEKLCLPKGKPPAIKG